MRNLRKQRGHCWTPRGQASGLIYSHVGDAAIAHIGPPRQTYVLRSQSKIMSAESDLGVAPICVSRLSATRPNPRRSLMKRHKVHPADAANAAVLANAVRYDVALFLGTGRDGLALMPASHCWKRFSRMSSHSRKVPWPGSPKN